MNEYQAMVAALTATGIPFAEHAWVSNGQRRTPAPPYGIYGPDGSGENLWGDDRLVRQVLQGTIDLFTTDNGKEGKALIESALDSCGVSWYLNSIQYENDTGLTHHEWVFEVI